MMVNINTSIQEVNRHRYLLEHRCGYTFARMEYGQRLTLAMKHAGLNQTELAARAKVSQPTISYLVNPDKRATGSEFTARFARECGVSVDWLSDELGEMIPNYFQTTDPKIIAAAKVMQESAEYVKDAAVEAVLRAKKLADRARENNDNNGTDG